MRKYDYITLHLPDGTEHILAQKDVKEVVTDEVVVTLRKMFSECEAINVTVEPDIEDRTMENRVLILWGDTLKNSYLSVQRFSRKS